MKENPLRKLHALSQSIWLDYIRRDLISSGELRRLIASAKSEYKICRQIFGGERFGSLASENARAQRPLWASTGTKNLNYGDTKYVEALIGADTVNTLPVVTLDAYCDHGDPKGRIEDDVEQAGVLLVRSPQLGISIDYVAQQLENEGVVKFTTPFDKLLATLLQMARFNRGAVIS